MKTVKEIEVNGCVCVPADVETEFFIEKFLEFIDKSKWTFGGGFTEVVDLDKLEDAKK
jgi:hypothetical protein